MEPHTFRVDPCFENVRNSFEKHERSLKSELRNQDGWLGKVSGKPRGESLSMLNSLVKGPLLKDGSEMSQSPTSPLPQGKLLSSLLLLQLTDGVRKSVDQLVDLCSAATPEKRKISRT